MLNLDIGRGNYLTADKYNNGRWKLSLINAHKRKQIAQSITEEEMLHAFSLFVGQPTQDKKIEDLARKFKKELLKSLKTKSQGN